MNELLESVYSIHMSLLTCTTVSAMSRSFHFKVHNSESFQQCSNELDVVNRRAIVKVVERVRVRI